MAEQSGHSIAAVVARLSSLARRQQAVAAADGVLAAALMHAHTVTVEARSILDRIEADIEAMIARQHSVSPDTASGALELHRFLLTKQREIIAVVSSARDVAVAKNAVLNQIMRQYDRSVVLVHDGSPGIA